MATRHVKYTGRSEGDQKMERQAESDRRRSAVERAGAEPTGSDSLQKPRRLYAFRPPGEEGSGDVHGTAKQAGGENSRESTRTFNTGGDGSRRSQVKAPRKRV